MRSPRLTSLRPPNCLVLGARAREAGLAGADAAGFAARFGGYFFRHDFFYFAGRDYDWLRVDGENFAAAPVESILKRHPDVVLASSEVHAAYFGTDAQDAGADQGSDASVQSDAATAGLEG